MLWEPEATQLRGQAVDKERQKELAEAKKWPDTRHVPLGACVPGFCPAIAHSAGRGSFWVRNSGP